MRNKKNKEYIVRLLNKKGVCYEEEFIEARTKETACFKFISDNLDEDDDYDECEVVVYELTPTLKAKHIVPKVVGKWETKKI